MGMPEQPGGAPAIEAVGVTKRFRTTGGAAVDAVHDLTLSVASGERLAFIGPNGAGKSTSIKMLTGILHPTSGDARVLGLVPWQQRRKLSERTGTLFGQRSQLWFELSARQSMRMLAAIYGMDRARETRRVAELGELLDATDLFDVPVRGLSLGQRMRCELAACLLHEPDILFLDEPTASLDPGAKREVEQLIEDFAAEGMTVVIATHNLGQAKRLANRVAYLEAGRLVVEKPVDEFFQTDKLPPEAAQFLKGEMAWV
jgi:ABC-2 type transport system ATP-binding protein